MQCQSPLSQLLPETVRAPMGDKWPGQYDEIQLQTMMRLRVCSMGINTYWRSFMKLLGMNKWFVFCWLIGVGRRGWYEQRVGWRCQSSLQWTHSRRLATSRSSDPQAAWQLDAAFPTAPPTVQLLGKLSMPPPLSKYVGWHLINARLIVFLSHFLWSLFLGSLWLHSWLSTWHTQDTHLAHTGHTHRAHTGNTLDTHNTHTGHTQDTHWTMNFYIGYMGFLDWTHTRLWLAQQFI